MSESKWADFVISAVKRGPGSGKIIQVPVTPKEQNFLREVATYYDLGPAAIEEFSKVPKPGFSDPQILIFFKPSGILIILSCTNLILFIGSLALPT